MFHWYHVNADGTADVYEDSPYVCARIDSLEPNWYASPEGAILHGGVKATAFTRKTEATYDAVTWLHTGALVFAGDVTTTTITTSRG